MRSRFDRPHARKITSAVTRDIRDRFVATFGRGRAVSIRFRANGRSPADLLDTTSDIPGVCTMSSVDDLFKGCHFDREIMTLCVRSYSPAIPVTIALLRVTLEYAPFRSSACRMRVACGIFHIFEPPFEREREGGRRSAAQSLSRLDNGEATYENRPFDLPRLPCENSRSARRPRYRRRGAVSRRMHLRRRQRQSDRLPLRGSRVLLNWERIDSAARRLTSSARGNHCGRGRSGKNLTPRNAVRRLECRETPALPGNLRHIR